MGHDKKYLMNADIAYCAHRARIPALKNTGVATKTFMTYTVHNLSRLISAHFVHLLTRKTQTLFQLLMNCLFNNLKEQNFSTELNK